MEHTGKSTTLQAYIKEHHITGLSSNAQVSLDNSQSYFKVKNITGITLNTQVEFYYFSFADPLQRKLYDRFTKEGTGMC